MATKTSIIIKSVDENNKATSRSITDVSNTATNSQLKDFAEALNNTSINTYQSSSKVQTTDLDVEEPTKLQRDIKLAKFDPDVPDPSEAYVTIPSSLTNDMFDVTGSFFIVQYLGTGIPTICGSDGLTTNFSLKFRNEEDPSFQNKEHLRLAKVSDSTLPAIATSGTLTVAVAENDSYQAASFEITLTGGNS